MPNSNKTPTTHAVSLARVQQQLCDHIKMCEERATTVGNTLGAIFNKLERMDTKFSGQWWRASIGIIGFFALIIISLVGYIWATHT